MKNAGGNTSYEWQGRDMRGHLQQGILQAAHADLARAQLQREGIHVLQLRRLWGHRHSSVPTRVITSMTRQWATLIHAGISLVPALQMLARSTHHPATAALLERVRKDVESGLPLSQALQKHPEAFGALYVSMIHAGETAGILDTMMERLASTLEKNEALRTRMRSALSYPAAVITIALAVLVLILLYVVPVFEEVFQSFGAALPWSTRAVLSLSHAIGKASVWGMLPALVLLVWLHHRWRQPAWQRQWHRWILEWPWVGQLVRAAALARWANTLAALLAAGTLLPEALRVAGRASDHPVYERISEHLQRRVAQGGRLSDGLAHTGRFPDLLVQLCATGEDSGTLDLLLDRAAALMTEELDARVQALSSLLEPLIIVVLGGAIGVILVAMYLPIFRLGQVF